MSSFQIIPHLCGHKQVIFFAVMSRLVTKCDTRAFFFEQRFMIAKTGGNKEGESVSLCVYDTIFYRIEKWVYTERMDCDKFVCTFILLSV